MLKGPKKWGRQKGQPVTANNAVSTTPVAKLERTVAADKQKSKWQKLSPKKKKIMVATSCSVGLLLALFLVGYYGVVNTPWTRDRGQSYSNNRAGRQAGAAEDMVAEGNDQEAIRAIDRAIRDAVDDTQRANLYMHKASICQRIEDIGCTIGAYQEVVKYSQDDNEIMAAYMLTAFLAEKDNQNTLAIETLRAAIHRLESFPERQFAIDGQDLITADQLIERISTLEKE